MTRRVVVTGLGVVAPGATGAKSFWTMLTDGRTATRPVGAFDATGFRSRIAAECDFRPEDGGITEEQVWRLDRVTQFALAAAGEALADSGLVTDPPAAARIGVSIGSAVGCTQRLEQEYRALSDGGAHWEIDPARATEHLYDYFVPSSIAAEVAWAAGAQGPVRVISAGCTSGIDAIGHARDLIAEGSADVVVAGGADAPIAPITVACFDAIKATSSRNDDPARACRPFDRSRDGFVLGEGSAVVVLESEELARRRGARPYATIRGYASRSNAYHMTGLRADGAEMAAAIRAAVDDARCPLDRLDYVNAHGTATVQNDRHETAALKTALGARAHEIPVSSIKSMIGHSLGAVGSLEIVACTLALTHGVVPPTATLEEPDPELDLDYVPRTAREARLDTVLTVGSGFGGFQSAMLLDRAER